MNFDNNGKPKTLSDFSPFSQSSLLNPVLLAPARDDTVEDEVFEDEDLDDQDFVEKVFSDVIEEADKAEAVEDVIADVSGVEEIADVAEIEKVVKIANVAETGGKVLGAVGSADDRKDTIPKSSSSSWFTILCKCGGGSKKKIRREDIFVSVKQSAA